MIVNDVIESELFPTRSRLIQISLFWVESNTNTWKTLNSLCPVGVTYIHTYIHTCISLYIYSVPFINCHFGMCYVRCVVIVLTFFCYVVRLCSCILFSVFLTCPFCLHLCVFFYIYFVVSLINVFVILSVFVIVSFHVL